jgi:hypothetical protein
MNRKNLEVNNTSFYVHKTYFHNSVPRKDNEKVLFIF